MQRTPVLAERHRSVRLLFAENHIQFKKKWRIIFIDAKNFDVDECSDGFNYYYYGLRKKLGSNIKEQILSFQHDNFSVHADKIVKTFLATNNDLNIIENIRGNLAKTVHAQSRQFLFLGELKQCIEHELH